MILSKTCNGNKDVIKECGGHPESEEASVADPEGDSTVE